MLGDLVGKYWTTTGMEVINVVRPSVFANWLLSKLGSYLPLMVKGAEGAVSFCDYISKGWLPGP